MDPIEVVVIADKTDRYCRSCESGRTMKEITASLTKQLSRRFGETVVCRFVDIHEIETAGFAHVSTEAHAGRAGLPIVLIDEKIRYRGLFSPTFIQRDIQSILNQREPAERKSSERKGTVLSKEQIHRLRMRQLLQMSSNEQRLNRLSHVPSLTPKGKA